MRSISVALGRVSSPRAAHHGGSTGKVLGPLARDFEWQLGRGEEGDGFPQVNFIGRAVGVASVQEIEKRFPECVQLLRYKKAKT